MRKILIIASACLTLAVAGCVDHAGARRVLTEDGYTDIKLADTTPFFAGCGEHDFYATPFEAKNQAGKVVRGVVCAGAGWGKATTIRRY